MFSLMFLIKVFSSIKKAIVISFKIIYLCCYYVIVAPIKLLVKCIK